MFYQTLMNEAEKELQQEVRKFVRNEVSHDFIRALDRDEIQYPREYVENLAAHNLLGLRFDPQCGHPRSSLKKKSVFWATPWAVLT